MRKEMTHPNIREEKANRFPYYKTYWAAAILVGCATFLVYLFALKNGFVNWDDDRYIYENYNIRLIDFEFFKWAFKAVIVSLWLPLTLISYAIDYAIWGLDPWGYHLTNNLLHVINTLLVFLLAGKLMMEGPDGGKNSKTLIAATLTAILFGIHPLHVESVAWVSERKDVLSAFFYLLSLLAYLKYVSVVKPKKYLFYGSCLILFILSLMSKPMAVTLPIVLLILDIYPLNRLMIEGKEKKNILIEKLPFFFFSFLSSLIALWTHHSAGPLSSSDTFPVIWRIFVVMRAYIFYLVKMILPFNLAPLYPYPMEIDVFTMEYLGSFVLVSAISFLCIWLSKRNRLFLAIWLYYIMTLIPVIGIVKIGSHAAADRYTYLPSLGPLFLAGLGVGAAFGSFINRRYRVVLVAALILLTVILAGRSVRQIAIWHDSITLWSYEIKHFPDSVYKAYFNRGNAYVERRSYYKAIKDYDKAIELYPENAKIYYNRGNGYAEIGSYDKAMMDYDKTMEIDPKDAKIYYNRGNIYDITGNRQQAVRDYGKAIELAPAFVRAYINRGNVHMKSGDHRQAINDYNKAIELDPKEADAYYNRGTFYGGIGDYRRAVEDFNTVVRLNPLHPEAYNNLGMAYMSLGDYQQAINMFKKVIELNPKFFEAYYNLGIIYSRLGDVNQALLYKKKAADIGLEPQRIYQR